MANLAKCGDCAALTLNTDDDISRHRLWHKDWDAKFRNTRTAAVEARDALGGLRGAIASYSAQLSQQPVIEPEQITVEDFPEEPETDTDDLTGYAGEPTEAAADLDNPVSTYADDNVAATVVLEPADLPLPTGSVTNLYSS